MTSSIIEDTIHHCQTQLKEERFHYIWNIVDFWNIYKFNMPDLYSSKAKNNFKFRMSPIENNNKLNLYCWIDNDKDDKDPPKKPFLSKAKDICYSVLIKGDEQEITRVSSKHIQMEAKTQYLLHSLLISQLPRTYSSSMTLTIYFEFSTFIEIFDNNIYYSYKRLAPMTNTDDILIHEEKPDSYVTFVIYDKCLKANKYLLCSKSKVFEAMINDLQESNEIKITDIGLETLKELLFFVKTGYLPKRMENKNLYNDTYNMYNICQLFRTAEKYDIQDLKLICEQHLIICTTVQNVVYHLEVAYSNNGKILAKYTKSFIKLYLKVIMNDPEFISLIEKYPELLTQIINSD
ncbi:Protein roadkill [Camponotus japonicus]